MCHTEQPFAAELIKKSMHLPSNEVHIIIASLESDQTTEHDRLSLLAKDELERANRYYFPIHKTRFIAARAMLREILSYYLNCPPEDITFFYDQYQKPYQLIDPDLHFNVSHSENNVIYGLSSSPLGIDIEKVQTDFHPEIAERFFSQIETQALSNLPHEKAIRHFYRLWAKKEALVKAIGRGLGWSLSSFSVSLENIVETIAVDEYEFTLHPLLLHSDFESAVAVHPTMTQLSYWKWEGIL